MKNLKPITCFLLLAMVISLKGYAQKSQLGKPLNTIIIDYLALEAALINESGNDAAVKGKALLGAINVLPQQGFTPAEKAYIIKLKYDSRHISEVTRIVHQREHFASLSDRLYNLIKKHLVNEVVLYWRLSSTSNTYFLSDKENSKDPYTGLATGTIFKEKLSAAQK